MTNHVPLSAEQVQLRVPATGAYLSVLRTAAAGLAARLEFTVDDIEDLRIAVDEACAMVLPLAADGSQLDARFVLRPHDLEVVVSVPSAVTEPPRQNTFAWTVLRALTDEIDVTAADGQLTLTLRKRRAVSR